MPSPIRAIVVAAALLAPLSVAGCTSDTPAPTSTTVSAERTVRFDIPLGTIEKLGRVRSVDIMPTEVNLQVGDTLVIKNHDKDQVEVGPYLIRPGETIRQRFTRPQTIVGTCGLSTSGIVRIVVTASTP